MKCPSCGAEASGNFCSACGSPLDMETCPSCGEPVRRGTKFCTSCGEAVPRPRGKTGAGVGKAGSTGAPAGEGEKVSPKGKAGAPPRGARTPGGAGLATDQTPRGRGNLAWWVAGGLLVVLIFALGYPILTRDGAEGGGAPGGAPTGMGGMGGGETGAAVDLTTMSLEEQATVLFNRVMTSNSTGDTADVAFFLPKALVIHEQLAPSDPDGLYHYALLHQVAGDHEAALETAREGLAQVPDHLLHLAVAAESLAALGDTAAAREHYTHFLDVYEEEMETERPGYGHHQRILPAYREEARAFVSQG